MHIDINELQKNVNLFAKQPGFVNLELHYIIAKTNEDFRFATWDEEADDNEIKYYCFLSDHETTGENAPFKESYVLSDDPIYPIVSNFHDFKKEIESISIEPGLDKGIRRFHDSQIEGLQNDLWEEFVECEKHVVTSVEAKHLLFVVKDVEVSISKTMVYFRYKAPFAERHYNTIKEEAHQ